MFSAMRRDDWPERMAKAVREHRTLPFTWGQSDCGVFFSDVAWAMTDEDPMLIFGRWNSEQSALKALVRAEVTSVKEYLDANLERIPASAARRGDAGYNREISSLSCPAIIVGREAISRNPDGWIRIPITQLDTVYRIG